MQSTHVRKWWWLLPFLVLDVCLFLWWRGGEDGGLGCADRRQPLPRPTGAEEVVIPPLIVTFPTAQRNLDCTNDASVFMPTASGRVESALYGSVRTRSSGGRLLPAFHEGLDIAPLERDRSGHPRDDVRAIADGTVVYANRIAGNSSYGRYIVIEHTDAIGPVFSLYAHLARIGEDVREGTPVGRGDPIGIMGNSSTLGIPLVRGHLHLEVGLMLTRHFAKWCHAKKLPNPHGMFHGWNLTGIDPLALYPTPDEEHLFRMSEVLSGLRPAFEVLIEADGVVDYFKLYPSLWHGAGPPADHMVLAVSEGGVVIGGRPGTAEERARLGKAAAVVLSVDREVLGRNGNRLVVARGSGWELSSKGMQWIDILTH